MTNYTTTYYPITSIWRYNIEICQGRNGYRCSTSDCVLDTDYGVDYILRLPPTLNGEPEDDRIITSFERKRAVLRRIT